MLGKQFYHICEKRIALSNQSIQSPFAMLEKVQKLLENQSLRELADKTSLPLCWLYRVKNGSVKSPNLIRLEFLYDYLKQL